MQLFYSVNSPYARKCRVVVLEKGLKEKVEFVERFPLANPIPPDLLAANPLGRVPALVTDEGMALCESTVICDYLDSLNDNPRLIPQDRVKRTMVLGLQAMSDGILDAAVQCVMENRRPEDKRWPEWVERKETSIRRTLAQLAPHTPGKGDPVSMATLALAVTLSYVNFRLPQIDWKSAHPKLASWYEAMALRSSMQETQPVS